MPAAETKVYGLHACRAVFERRPDDVLRAWVTEGTVPEVGDVLRALARARRPYKVTDAAELERVAGAKHHGGICMLVREHAPATLDEVVAGLPEGLPARMVYLDGVGNPHNLGAILRVGAHFGAAAVLGRAGELPSLSGAARRVAEGGAEHVPVVPLADPERALADLASRGFALVATAADAAEDLFAVELPPRCVYLLGAERTGLSPAIRRLARRALAIPGTRAVESLNVSTACAVLLAEHWRQRGGAQGGA